MNNTSQHISNESVYVKFDPSGTSFDSGIVNVQAALAQLSPDGVSGVPHATESIVGKARFATEDEVLLGIDATTMVSPATLNARMQRPFATTDIFGTTRYATNDEALAGLATDRTIVASALKHVFDWTFENRLASETATGVMKISTTLAATAGVDDTTSMTPLKTQQAIAAATAIIPVWGPATEAEQGVVRLATLAQLRTPTIREGYSMSPFTMNQWQATEANIGAAKIAAASAMNLGTSDTEIVTPLKFVQTRANATRVGTVKLTDVVSGDATLALSGASKVLRSDVATVSIGGVFEGSTDPKNKYMTRQDLRNTIPVGTMMLAAYQDDRGVMLICNGRWLNKNEWPELFAAIGFTFGGDGINAFALPDMRGVVARGTDLGRNLDPGRPFGSYQDDTIQNMGGTFPIANRWRGRIDGVFRQGESWNTNYKNGGGDDWGKQVYFEPSRVVRVSGETRAKSVAVNYVICAR